MNKKELEEKIDLITENMKLMKDNIELYKELMKYQEISTYIKENVMNTKVNSHDFRIKLYSLIKGESDE